MPIYMKYEGVDGDVTTKGFEKCIELTSAQFGHARAVTSIGANDARRGTPQVTDLVVTKPMDVSSTDLFRDSLMGQGKKVTLYFVATGVDKSTPFLTVELENTLISSFAVTGGHAANDKPVETLTFNFTKITYTTTTLDEKLRGTPKSVTYDLQTGSVH